MRRIYPAFFSVRFGFICFLLLLLCFGKPLQSEIVPSEAAKKIVWVFFKDKGFSYKDDLKTAMDNYKNQMPAKAILRRQKPVNRLGISDLPVFAPYIEGVLQHGAKLRVASKWLNGITVEVPDSSIPQILKLPYIRSIEPVVTYRRIRSRMQDTRLKIEGMKRGHLQYAPTLSDTGVEQSAEDRYGMSAAQIQQIHVNALHDRDYHGEGVIVALLDTGFDLSHKALRNIRVLAKYDFVNGDYETSDEPPEDDIGQSDHGTEVLSIIAGYNPGEFIGAAYAADYLLAKTERVSSNGVFFEEEIEEDWWVAGLEWAEFNGADIVSSSLGYSDWYSYSDMNGATAKTTIAANMAVEKGMTVIVSVGNEGKSSDWPYMSAPADGIYVIAVGAVNYMGEVTDFSSIGPTYDGRIKPDLVAMGDDDYVVDPNSTDEYRKADGTSMATPLVAGAAALLIQALPDLDGPKELVKLLKHTATQASSPDNRYGWGLVDAEAAFEFGASPRSMEELKKWDPNGTASISQHLSIYPNPVRRGSTAGRISISSPEPIESVRIYSLSGTLVFEKQDMNGAKLFVWDLKNQYGHKVANGIYFCAVRRIDGALDSGKIAVMD